MHFFSVIIQPFILIALGFLLSRLRMFPRSLWEGVEKLVYYVLFPPLLFNSVARAEPDESLSCLRCGIDGGRHGARLDRVKACSG